MPFFQYGRYKGACGGRSSGKSHGFAEMLVEEHLINANTSSVCVREIQKSIQQSVKRLLEHKIEAMNAGAYFTVQDAIIKNNYGRGIIIFQGLQNHTADSIKSLEGFDRVWVEEAQSVSQWSMDILRPTFRKPGSEMWFTWNPRFEDDAVEKLFRPKNGEPPNDTILQVVNYLDNPFCPREAIEEAEYCARHDPDRYAHIWMGDYLTNSDARVFNNFEVREFELPDGSAFRTGIDWGFAIDPTAAVRCCLDGRTLYIDHEAYKHQCEIIDTPDLLLSSIPEIARYPAVADSARPETISYVKSHGIPRIEAAKKGKDSVEEGVEWLRSLRIVIHPRCKNTIYEFSRYMYKVDERTNDVLPQLVDKDNHCIAEGEKVLTHRGNIPIEDVRVGDLVLTRKGFKRVLFSGITDRNRETVLVKTTNGKLRCTPDHRIYTTNRGFVRADALRYNDEVFIVPKRYALCLNLLSMAARFGEGIQKARVRLAGIISGAAKSACIVRCGLTIMEKFRKASRFITKTATRATMTLRTWNVSHQESIQKGTGHKNEASSSGSGWIKSGLLPLSGTEAKQRRIFTNALARLREKTSRLMTRLVSIAGRFLRPENLATLTNSVQTLANLLRAEKAAWMTLCALAHAEESSPVTSTASSVFVPGRVQTITPDGTAKRVYDLTIDEQHEFFASLVLVLNCVDAARYACEAWRKPAPMKIKREAIKAAWNKRRR